jgi:hypothetical protein
MEAYKIQKHNIISRINIIYTHMYEFVLVERILSELIFDKVASNTWIKFLSTKKHYNIIIMYCNIIIITTRKLCKVVKTPWP